MSKNNRVDPFATISDKEVLWQEVSDSSQEARAGGVSIDGIEKREAVKGMSAEDVKKSWADYRSRKKQKSLKTSVGE